MAGPSIQIGRGHIEIVPLLSRDFDSRLRQDLQDRNRKTGDDLGRQVGRNIFTGIGTQLRKINSLDTYLEDPAQILGQEIGQSIVKGMERRVRERRELAQFVTDSGRDSRAAAVSAGEAVGRQIGDSIAHDLRRADPVTAAVTHAKTQASRSAGSAGASIGERLGGGLFTAAKLAFKAEQFKQHVRRQLEYATFVAPLPGRTLGEKFINTAAVALRAGEAGIAGSLVHVASRATQRTVSRAAAPLTNLGHELAHYIGQGIEVAAPLVQAAMGPVTAAVVSGLAGIAVQVTAALAPAAGALLALPAAASAAAQGLAVLKLAFSGVGDALKAHAEEQANAAATARSAAAAARSRAQAEASAADAVISARERLAQAYQQSSDRAIQAQRALVRAQRDVTHAMREDRDARLDLIQVRKDETQQLADLRKEVDRSADTEEAAILRVAEARQHLSEVLNDRRHTPLEEKEAQLAVREAQNNLDDTREKIAQNAAAYRTQAAAGVDGSRQVIAAQERVEQATQGVADAQQAAADAQKAVVRGQQDSAREIADAQRGLAAALRQQAAAAQSSSTATHQYADALAKLPPPAREFVQTLVAMSPLLKQLKASAAGVFPGMTASLRELATNFPVVNEGVDRTARGLSRVAASVGPAFSGPVFRRDLAGVMQANAQSTEAWGHAFVSVARGFWDVVAAGAPVVAQQSLLGQALAENIRQWVAAKRASGELQDWMIRGVATVRQLARIIVDIATGIRNLFRAVSGDSVLDTLERISQGFVRVSGSVRTMDRLQEFFAVTDDIASRAGRAITGFFRGVSSGQQTSQGFVGFFERAGAGARHFTEFVTQHLWPLLRDIGSVFIAAGKPALAFTNGLLGVRGGGVSAMIDGIRRSLAPAFADLKKFFTDATPFAAQIGALFRPISSLVFRIGTLHAILGFFLNILKAVAWVLAHVVGPAMTWFSSQSDGTRHAIFGFAAAFIILNRSAYTLRQVARLFTELNAARQLIQAGNHIRGLIGVLRALTGFAGRMNPLYRAFHGLISTVQTLRRIFDFTRLGTLLQHIFTVTRMRAAFRGLGVAIRGVAGVITHLRTALNLLRTAFLTNPFGIILLAIIAVGAAFYLLYKHSETFRNAVNGIARWAQHVGQMIWDGFTGKLSQLVGWLSGLPGRLYHAFVDPLLNLFGIHSPSTVMIHIGQSLIDGFVGGIRAVEQILWGVVNFVFSTIRQIISAELQIIQGIFRFAFDFFVTYAKVAFDLLMIPIRIGLSIIRSIFTAAVQLIHGDWRGAWDTIRAIPENIFNIVKGGISSALDAIRGFFRSAVRDLGSIWSGLHDLLAVPVRFFVDIVYNRGIRWAWNNTVGKIGIPNLPEIHVDGLAAGGRVRGPGGPRDDRAGLYALSDGEYVMPADTVRRYGVGYMDALRRQEMPAGLAGGGLIGSIWDATGGKVVTAAGDLLRDGAAAVADTVFDPLRAAIVRLLGDGQDWKGVISKLARSPLDAVVHFIRGTSNPPVPASGDISGNRALGKQLAEQLYGWTGDNWNALERLWTGESGWNHHAENPSSHAYGIPQSLPGSKMASAGPDWHENPATQIRWGLDYIRHRPDYGDPATAYAKWLSRSPHWYDSGGWLRPGDVGLNGTGRPEAVLTERQWSALESALSQRQGPAVSIGAVHVTDKTDVDLLARKLDFYQRRGGF